MPFDYYHRLSRGDQSIYRQSDKLEDVPAAMRQAIKTYPWARLMTPLRLSLEAGDRRETERISRRFLDQLNVLLETPPVRVQVRSVRPSEDWGELHGLYTPAEGRAWGLIEVWMRTAQHKRIVAFRTFLRTLLHELCHHLDYELFELDDSFHTEGFFKREARLFRHLGLAKPQPKQVAEARFVDQQKDLFEERSW